MNRLLVVVDYQNDFVDGALGFKGAEKISSNIASLIKEFRNNKDEVVFTYDTHDADYMNTVEGKNLPVPHCLKGSDGWALYPEINALLENAKVFEKPGFGSKELGHYIESKNFDEIYLCGLVTTTTTSGMKTMSITRVTGARFPISSTPRTTRRSMRPAFPWEKRAEPSILSMSPESASSPIRGRAIRTFST